MAGKPKQSSIVNGTAIKKRREALKLTMAEAAARAGLPSRQRWNTIESVERKNPSIETLYRIAHALNCRMEDLITPPKI